MAMADRQTDLHRAAALLAPWFRENARDLPWRKDRDPYRVWISEIMLQQTRVEAVTGYYARFLEALPTVRDLAAAGDDKLNKLWQGLGYYSRARNLKKAAQAIVNEHGGRFPETYEELLSLPGIGPYTAGAIASICFERPCPAVDGNVLRVYARLTAYGEPVNTDESKRYVTEALRPLYHKGNCGLLTQSLMELGACVCLPNGAPRCDACPLKELCAAFRSGTWERYPVKTEKKARRKEERLALLLKCGDRYALRKRPGHGLLAGLWEFPNTELADPENALGEAAAFAASLGVKPAELLRQTEYTHVFTHVEWHVRAFAFACEAMPESLTWATAKELEAVYAVPSAFRPVAETAGIQE